MADLVFVAILLVFFALALGLVKACERIIGPDEPSRADAELPDEAPEPVVA